jgi:hypothetical protein
MSWSFLKHKRQITLKGQLGRKEDIGGVTGTVSATGTASGAEAVSGVAGSLSTGSEGAGDEC